MLLNCLVMLVRISFWKRELLRCMLFTIVAIVARDRVEVSEITDWSVVSTEVSMITGLVDMVMARERRKVTAKAIDRLINRR